MTLTRNGHPFERSGLAALSDLQTSEWEDMFSFLENEQEIFLAQEKRFRSPQYPWPRDPLHWWSRVWEYPYAYHHLKAWWQENGTGKAMNVADVGSGVTFFPFAVAKLGYQVHCTDIDPICGTDLARAVQVVGHAPGNVSFRQTQGTNMPFNDGELDAIYCISVLEHIPQPSEIVREMARSLKPRGLLLLTLDIDLRGDEAIGPQEYRKLRQLLDQEFVLLQPEVFVHPMDMLHTFSGPYPFPKPPKAAHYWNELKQRYIKPLLGRKPGGTLRPRLAVQGLVLARRG